MKRKYEKPMLLKEEFSLENTIAACKVKNPQPSELEQCAYIIDGLDYMVFASDWASCKQDGYFIADCVQAGLNNLFSS